MSIEQFDGVAVHPKQVKWGACTKVGIWLNGEISHDQRDELIHRSAPTAHIGVSAKNNRTVVFCVGRITGPQAAKLRANILTRWVKEVVGIKSILRRALPDNEAVNRALNF